jgi:Tol biopolymer transport system component
MTPGRADNPASPDSPQRRTPDIVSPGTQLGPYEILGKIGAGGMGEVHKARDTRLDRIVAIKLLRGILGETPEFRRRFEREALATSALNHPHICALYDVGEQEGIPYLVMEYVDGGTVAERLRRGPLPFEQVLAYGEQVADALAAAHTAGIVHRDLKPANVMLARTAGGLTVVKVLDFGLAKIEARQNYQLSDETLTASNAVLGTPAYMAPEQLAAGLADPRTDIFALGLLLYEMATNRKPFAAGSPAGRIAEIMTGEPGRIEAVPWQFERVVRRCLAREPAQRWQSATDVKLELEDIRNEARERALRPAQLASRVMSPRRGTRWAWRGLVLGALLLAYAFGVFFAGSDIPDQSQCRFMPFAFDPGGQSDAVWSPDSKAVAYRARGNAGQLQVFIRRLGADVPVQVTHLTEPATPIAWSPDSRRVLFHSIRRPAGIWSIAAVGGEPVPILSMDLGPAQPAVAIAPDGNTAAIYRQDQAGIWGLWISSPLGSALKKYSPDTFSVSEVVTGTVSLRFSPDGGSILLVFDDFVRKSRQAWLVPYPGDPGKVPKRVLPDLTGYGLWGASFCWVSDNRHVLFSLQGPYRGPRQLWEADVNSGRSRVAFSRTGDVIQPAVSPDGRRVVFSERTSNFDIVSASLDGSAVVALLATDRSELMPDWASNQPVIAYVTDRNGPQEIWVRSGGVDRSVVTARDFPPDTTIAFMGPALSAQGERVVYKRLGTDNSRLWISATGGGALIPLTNDTVAEYPGSWSPDGAWFTYTRGNGQDADLMKVKTTGQATPQVLKPHVSDQNWIPAWSPAGDWIAMDDELISPDGKSVRRIGSRGSQHFVFSKDGRRVYGIRPEGDRNLLFAVDLVGNAETIIRDLGTEFRPRSSLMPGIRFSMGPDGKSFVFSIGTIKTNLWMAEGFRTNTGPLAQFGFR